MKYVLKAIWADSVFGLLVYLAYFENVKGTNNLVGFLVILPAVLLFILAMAKHELDYKEKFEDNVYKFYDHLTNWIFILFFAWAGWFWLAIGWFTASSCMALLKERSIEKHESDNLENDWNKAEDELARRNQEDRTN